MNHKKYRVLGLNGSLRASSASNQVMNFIASLLPENVEFNVYDNTGVLPHFDDSEVIPPAVINFREAVRKADAVIICTPEYAFGVPGTLKNALDWTVGSGDFDQKPVALITASTGGQRGHAALLDILQAISAKIPEGGALLIPFIRAKLSKEGKVSDAITKESLKGVVESVVKEIERVGD